MDKAKLQIAIKFTLEQQKKEENIKYLIDFLKETDYIILSDYEPKEDEDLEAIKAKRSEARKFIRENKGH